MIKPRYNSVKCNLGEKRGFFFAIIGVIWSLSFPASLCAQQKQTIPTDTWILVFGSDTLIIRKPLPVTNYYEAAYNEAWRHGYFSSELIAVNSTIDTLRAVFNKSDRFKWSDHPIKWIPNIQYDAQNCNLVDRPYTATNLEDCMDAYAKILVQSGYLSLSIVVDTLRIDYIRSIVSADVSITVGEIARLTDVTWDGLSKTGSKWLETTTGIKAGLALDEPNVRRITNRLYQTKLFETISKPEIYLNGDEWGLLISVKERPLTFFELLVGYVPDQSGKAVVAGTGQLHVRNAGFDGTDLTIDFNRQSSKVGKLLVDLDQNVLLGYPIGMSSSFSLIRQDTLWQNRIATLGIWWDVHHNLRVHTALNRDISTSSSSDRGSADLWGTFGQMGITLDTRNDVDNSSAGLFVDIMAELGRQLVEPTLDERYNHSRKRLMGNVDVHIPITLRNMVIPSFTSGTIISRRVPFNNDLWRIGGTKSLRGYREDQFFARSYLWGTLEYRFLLDPHSYLFVFGSSGLLWLPQIETNTGATERYKVGSFGFGLAYRTNLGLLSFTYAKSPEDPFSNAKVHVGISSGF